MQFFKLIAIATLFFSSANDYLFADELALGIRSRSDLMHWSESNGTINVSSEISWRDLHSTQLAGSAEISHGGNISFLGYLAWGNIDSGRGTDSDYSGNNRTLEYSRSMNTTRGEMIDFSAGMELDPSKMLETGSDTQVLSMLGYGINYQRLKMTDGIQIIPASGSFSNLDSSFDTTWHGPWLGLAIKTEFLPAWDLSLSGKIHWLLYSAKANWNLRTELAHPVSFEHEAAGKGYSLNVNATHKFNNELSLTAGMEFLEYKINSGIDSTHMANGTDTIYNLNEVYWSYTALNLSVNYSY